jgi:hypothetical protein
MVRRFKENTAYLMKFGGERKRKKRKILEMLAVNLRQNGNYEDIKSETNTQIYLISGLYPLSKILNTRKHWSSD